MRTAIVGGHWAQNIGNAFFNLGGNYLLTKAGASPTFVYDSPAYWTFASQKKGHPSSSFDLIKALDVEMVVLQGPLFTRHFPAIWAERLEQLDRVGVKWAVLSGALRKYTTAEVDAAVHVMERTPPAFVLTRDHATADALNSRGVSAVAGIDSAFMLGDAVPPVSLRTGQPSLVAFAFDHFLEPRLVPDDHGSIRIGNETFNARFPRALRGAARRGKVLAYAAHPFDLRRLPTEIAGHSVIRSEHRTNPRLSWKIGRRRWWLASDEPWSYLHLYANATFTYGDRVHACIAALAYGKTAMLHNPTTKRSSLFEAVGVPGITSQPCRLDPARFEQQKHALISDLRAALERSV